MKFDNANLNGIWESIVSATCKLLDVSTEWVFEGIEDNWFTVYIADGGFYSADPGYLLGSNGDHIEIGEPDPELGGRKPVPLTSLNRSVVYDVFIFNDAVGKLYYGMDIKKHLGGTGFKHVHNALIRHTGLGRNNTPTTPGDYLKGIAVCARHLSGKEPPQTGSNSLLEIANMLEWCDWEPSTDWELREGSWTSNFYISDGYLYAYGDPWRIRRSDTGVIVGYVTPSDPFSLLSLGAPAEHYIESDLGDSAIGAYLVFVG